MDVMYWRSKDDLLFGAPGRGDFVSPASQDVLREWDNPMWEPTFASRNIDLPMWERPDLFRTVSYEDTKTLNFRSPSVDAPAGTITPSGALSMDTVHRPVTVTLSDRDRYHADVQKVYALFLQFDTMTEHQIAAFTGLSMQRVSEVVRILHVSEILQTPTVPWRYDQHRVWRMNIYASRTIAYQNGMDALARVLCLGGEEMEKPPPRAGSVTSIKHNLFTAEMMLRLAESGDNVAGVWGEMFAAASRFHEPNPSAKQRSSHGDAVVVTKDGSVVVIETVGSVGGTQGAFRRIVEKAASWVGVIANSPLDLSVLFVDTTWHHDRQEMLSAVTLGVMAESKVYAPDDFLRKRAMPHVGVVNAAWWFPEDGSISQAGTRMAAYCPYNFVYREFDAPDPKFSDDDLRCNAVINSVSALHTPPWIRRSITDRDFRRG